MLFFRSRPLKLSIMYMKWSFKSVTFLKIRTQYFFWKISKKSFFLIFLFHLKTCFQWIFSFLESVVVYTITVIKVRDLLLALLQITTILVAVSKMNEHRLLILINTSYMINYWLTCLDYFYFAGHNSFSSEICIVL